MLLDPDDEAVDPPQFGDRSSPPLSRVPDTGPISAKDALDPDLATMRAHRSRQAQTIKVSSW